MKKKKRAKKRAKLRRGDTLTCGECGFTVTVDEPCGCTEYHPIICCGRKMKPGK